MAKYFGKIGFAEFRETTPGVYVEQIVESDYYGDVLRNSRRWQPQEALNDRLNISNSISIVADPYAFKNFHSIRYVEYMGAKWKVNYVEVQFPRLILNIGGVYNEQTIDSP